MSQKYPIPCSIFYTLENMVDQQRPPITSLFRSTKNFKLALGFLKQYDGSKDTFNTYRRDMERVLQWSWLIARKSVPTLKRPDIEDYIKFCHKPPKTSIGLKQVASRFVSMLQEDIIQANPVAQIKQKSKFIRKQRSAPKIPRLTEIQWQHVLAAAGAMAKKDPIIHERTLFNVNNG